LAWYYPKFGATTSPKHWHVLVLAISPTEEMVTNGSTKESEKRGTDKFLPHSILPFPEFFKILIFILKNIEKSSVALIAIEK
jgi:hypothetical protein